MRYQTRQILLLAGILPLVAPGVLSQEPKAKEQEVPVHLQVEAGTPLRLYITKRVRYRVGESVPAKVMEPVWAFDRIAIPAGAVVQGKVVKLDPVPKMARTQAILAGDFTPLKHAQVSFQNLTLPDGRSVPLQTEACQGLLTLYVPPKPGKKTGTPKASSARASRVRQFVEQQAQTQANARSRGLFDMVRAPNKLEWTENYLLTKLPYHPEWYRALTRFDAVLTQPLDFGTVEVARSEVAQADTPPPASIGQMRLVATISSSDSHVGDPMQGVLSQPLFTAQHKLLLPEGTRFTGHITLAQRARYFHRGGKLRFAIEQVDAPENEAASLFNGTPENTPKPQTVQGQLVEVEADPKAIKVDSEGTATATESKSRLLRPAIAAIIATKSLDNDAGKQTAAGGGSGTTAARYLGGFSGLGLLGTAAAYGPHPIGSALGFYGLAWSVYSTIISRGNDVTFEKNTAIAIQFGTPRKK